MMLDSQVCNGLAQWSWTDHWAETGVSSYLFERKPRIHDLDAIKPRMQYC